MPTQKTRLPMKPPLSAEQLAELLIARGLQAPQPDELIQVMRYVGYYRFSGYCRPFQLNAEHVFKEGTSFDQVWDTYIFDRKLRTHILDAVERIEVAIRTLISNTLAEHYQEGTWYLRHEVI